MKEKFIGKYMRIAKLVGEDHNPCYSRKIGVVIVNPIQNRIVGTGYNGPPPGTPHCDSEEFLRDYFWPQLTIEEKESFRLELGLSKAPRDIIDWDETGERFAKKYDGCRTCPRRLIKAGPGQRSELCSCGHAERHAITNSCEPLSDCIMFAWCGVPCLQCTDAIIQANIREVHCLVESDYQVMARWLFKKAGTLVIEHNSSEFV